MPRRKQNPQSLKQTVSTAIKKIVWRVAIYIRLSKDDGNDESYSVKNQRERLNDTLEQLMLDEDGIELIVCLSKTCPASPVMIGNVSITCKCSL